MVEEIKKLVIMSKLLKQAFTLIELLVVIAIVGILSGLIAVSMGGMTQKANIARSQVFSNSLKNSLMLNLISEWRLDEAGTVAMAKDSWSGNNPGTLVGFNFNTTDGWRSDSQCPSGNCLQFDGSDDCIDYGIKSNLNLQKDITVSFWVNPLTYNFGNSAAFIFGNGISSTYGYHIWLWKTGYIEYRSCQNGTQQGTTSSLGYIPQNTWTHIAVTRSGTVATIYINGVDRVSYHNSHLDPAFSASANSYSGRYPGGGYYLNGLLDEIRVYDAVIPSSQIKEQYYAGLNKLLAGGGIIREDYQQRIAELENKTTRE